MLPILNESFWRDEAFSALLSQHNLLDIIKLSAKDQSPPLYPILLHFWMQLFGTTEVAIRSLSLLFHFGTTLLAILLLYRLTKSLTASLLTGFAVLLNPFLLQYAFEARTYSLLAFLTALTVYAISKQKYWLAGITMALGIYSHNFALFTAVSIGSCWLILNRTRVLKKIHEGIELFIFPVFAVISWGFVVWNQWVRVGHDFWIKPVTSAIFLQTFESFTRGDLNYPARHFLVIASYILVFFAASFWIWKKEKETDAMATILFTASIGPIIIAYAISALFAPIFYDRYLIASVPLLIVLIAYSLWKFLQENPAKKTALIVFVSCLCILVLYASEQILNSYQKPAINWAVMQIIQQAQPGDVIIPKDYLNYLETTWYVQQSGKPIPVYAYSPTGTVPYYVGSILYNQKDIITKLPTKTRYWEIEPSGGYTLLVPTKK